MFRAPVRRRCWTKARAAADNGVGSSWWCQTRRPLLRMTGESLCARGVLMDDGQVSAARAPLVLTSKRPADSVLCGVQSSLASRRLPTFSHWKRAATSTGKLEVIGYVNGDCVEVKSWRPAQRDPLIQPTLTGRVVATDSGCMFTGAIETRMPGAPVLVGFSSIVGLALVAGAIGIIMDALHGHRAAAMHWLPLLIGPAVMVGFAFMVIAVSRAQARGRERFLREWLAGRLA